MVEFENYRGPAFIESKLLCIAICPITVSLQTEIGIHERQKLPLRLAWALTIRKSQGLTLAKHGLTLANLKELLQFPMLLLAE